ncbi:glutathione S-transferase family protein [Paracoccus sp. p3-h83]|uniref:glutathione S-transferase family protein n=1 Tax=Paracoccus sp. p3-h83 TaxID=3342805 RepID=UPI0035B72F0A
MKLYGFPGSGSAIVEAQLAVYGLPAALIDGDPAEDAAAHARIAALNPLLQVPVLELDDGKLLTESAAMTLCLADLTGREDLVPAVRAPERAAFLRWLIFLVANIYPCFTYADEPSRFVAEPQAAKSFRAAVDAHQQRLWMQVEQAAVGPWFLGDRFSALDIYLAVMIHWRPRPVWFTSHARKLTAAAVAATARGDVGPVITRHFG